MSPKREATHQLVVHVPRSLWAEVERRWPSTYATRSVQNAFRVALKLPTVISWLEVLIRIAKRLDADGKLSRHERELLLGIEKDLRREAIDGHLEQDWRMPHHG